jgi:2-isopropylmalate synthase
MTGPQIPAPAETDPAIKIEIFDTTLRDVAQSLPDQNQFPQGSKVELADRIAMIGTDTIEAGFPATMGDAEEIAEVARTVGQKEYRITPTSIVDGEWVELPDKLWTPVITGLTTAREAEIIQSAEAVREADRPGVHLFIATAEEHMRAKHPHMTRDEVLAMGVRGIRLAREAAGPDAVIEFSCEAASTTDSPFLDRAVRTALQEDINVLNLPDTLGAASPIRMGGIFDRATRIMAQEGRLGEVKLSSHNHDDGQRAVQNAISTLHAIINVCKELDVPFPIFQVEGTWVPGGGERNGNLFFPPFGRNVLTDRDEFEAAVELTLANYRMKETVEFIMAMAGLELDPNTPVVGDNTITHRSGVHSDAIAKGGASTYSKVDNRGFGHKVAAVLEDGKYQGSRGKDNLGGTDTFRSELVVNNEEVGGRISAMGMEVSSDELEAITVTSNRIAKARQVPISDIEIESMVAEAQGIELEDRYKIEDFDFHRKANKAEVRLSDTAGKTYEATETHSKGAIDAYIKAVNTALGFDGDLQGWKAQPVIEQGSASEGGVIFEVVNDHRVKIFAKADSVDEATLKGYVDGINLVERIEQRRQTAREVDN